MSTKHGVIIVTMQYLRLPEGTQAVQAIAQGDQVAIVIEHDTMPDVPDGSFPLLQPRFERNAAGQLCFADWGHDLRRNWQQPETRGVEARRKRWR